MRTSILIIALFLSSGAFSQKMDSSQIKTIDSIIEKVVTDADFTKPWPVTANHDTLQNKFLGIFKSGDFSPIFKFIETPGFDDVIVETEKGMGIVRDPLSISALLSQILEELPNNIDLKPSLVSEDKFFARHFRTEIWDYVDKNGIKKDIRITFTNGQITNIMFWL